IAPEAAEDLGLERDSGPRGQPIERDQAVALGRWLQERRGLLLELSTRDILGDLGRLAAKWLGPEGEGWRERAEARLAEETGYPRALVADALRHLFASYSAPVLRRLVLAEPFLFTALDRFRRSLPGRSRAFGPALTLLFASGNVPVAAVPSLYHSLMAKSPCLARVPSSRPGRLPFFCPASWDG